MRPPAPILDPARLTPAERQMTPLQAAFLRHKAVLKSDLFQMRAIRDANGRVRSVETYDELGNRVAIVTRDGDGMKLTVCDVLGQPMFSKRMTSTPPPPTNAPRAVKELKERRAQAVAGHRRRW